MPSDTSRAAQDGSTPINIQSDESTVAVSSSLPSASVLLTQTPGQAASPTPVPPSLSITSSSHSRTSSSASIQSQLSQPIPRGMSTAQAAAIGVSVPLACALAITAVFLWRRKRHLRHTFIQETNESTLKDDEGTAKAKILFVTPRAALPNSKAWDWFTSNKEERCKSVASDTISVQDDTQEARWPSVAKPKPVVMFTNNRPTVPSSTAESEEDIDAKPPNHGHESRAFSHRTASDSWGSEVGRIQPVSFAMSSKTTMSSVNPFFYDLV
ncbi:MAG: hypothetical protein CYPHOPRED_000816 [Cyphobasidiales sp. Tagirdzhanova-0007]|nr:MAG: hypothetical protein CYPHOPRED_000816 [Cyphobasidiales sp. Tagirdzhanova-0007]